VWLDQNRRTVGLRHHDAKRCPFGVAGIEQPVLVGVEHLPQRFHVAAGRGIPIGEHHFFFAGDLAVAIGVEDEHAIANPGPRGAVVIAVAADVEILRAVVALGDGNAVAVEIEQDRAFAGGTAASARTGASVCGHRFAVAGGGRAGGVASGIS
tara:strand:- start:5953 stop:6411 length:459 start_codon:yes stop_codon:yes gene_type:complete